ncbi:MAG: MATE family efflux transporter [Clostridium sp.]|nr:MATE family efflux transporter [Clostridium sp.]
MRLKFLKDKKFLKSMFSIAIPVAIQNLITSSLNMVDTVMISSLGKSAIAAVGLANQVFFFYIVVSFGINSGSSIFIAQYWGKRDKKNIKKVLGLAITLSGLLGLIFTILAFFFPEFLMGLLIQDPDVILIGSKYLKVVSLSYIVTAISFAYSVALRTTGKANIPVFVSIVSVLTNVFFNYALIFGKFGFPQMGVVGAAWGTVIARFLELGVTILFVYMGRGVLAASFKELFSYDKSFFRRYIITTWPVILNEAFWSLGQVMYSIAYAKMGEEATAAVQVATTVQNMFLVVVKGLANACTIMVGAKIGAGEEEEAYDYAIQFLLIATLFGVFLGLTQSLTPRLTLMLFSDLDPGVYEASRKILIILGFTFIVRMFNSTAIVGVLRGGGDTAFSMKLELVSVWLIGVPIAFIGVLVFKLPVYIVVGLVSLEELVKASIAYPRIKSKKWIRNVIE